MDIKKYIYSHCAFPKKVRIWDTYSMQYIEKEVPCGKCLHCRLQLQNSWVTRLYAQQAYSKHTYFITLDYAPFDNSKMAQLLSAETAAVNHNLNINHAEGLHPILLCKNHLDDFFKRLRKNGHIFQYFACGEYGKKWSRPHFHIILFSNNPITQQDCVKAWTLFGSHIGRVDFNDLVENGTTAIHNKSKYNSRYVFKYVCKYLLKGKFDFESLKTIEYHKLYFNSLLNCSKHYEDYEKIDALCSGEYQAFVQKSWSDYCKKYSPFISCSRKPAIGLQYLQEHVSRFKEADFRLFGLSKECCVFPRYFVRKTKEYSCSLKALGEDSLSPSSASRLPFITSVIGEILDARTDIYNFDEVTYRLWCKDRKTNNLNYVSNGELSGSISCHLLSFYDVEQKIMFIFNGYDYSLWQKSRKFFYSIGNLSLEDTYKYITENIQDYWNYLVCKLHDFSKYKENQLQEYIDYEYNGDILKFKQYVYDVYNKEISANKTFDIKFNNSHITF